MSLDLKPEVETTLRNYAEAEGVTPDTFVARLLARYGKQGEAKAEPAWKARLRASQQRIEQARLDSGITDEEIEADIDAAIKVYRKECATQEMAP